MDYDSFLELVQKRRSIRRFKPDPIPDEYINKVIDAAVCAPSGANSQPWEFLVIKDRATREKIAAIMAETREQVYRMEQTRPEALRHPGGRSLATREGFRDAPVLIVLLGDPRTAETYILHSYYTRRESNLVSGLATAFVYMHLAAASLGLGSQWLSSTASPYVQAMMKSLLQIPDPLYIYDTMALGYRAYEPRPRLMRSRDEVTHLERYEPAKARTDQQVRDYIVRIHQDRIDTKAG
ncbi:MAG: nitroreductase family protein [Chloroflexi bacterium]|nr:nitroreductase family protein [Chloroflexota bacterium]